MSVLERLPLDRLLPSHVWAGVDAATRRRAAEALYQGHTSTESGRRHADAALAIRLSFREIAVRRMPVERRVQHLVAGVRTDDALASALLLALHLEHRRPLLEAFLTGLGIPNDGGLIRDDHDLHPPETERLAREVDALYASHAPEDVDLYLASLVALDPAVWGDLVPILRRRAGAPARDPA
jgi:hypothetical protein